MLIHTLEVRPKIDQPFFPYYKEEVVAPTAQAAIAMVERKNPNCMVRHCADRQMPSGMKRNNNWALSFFG